MFVSPSSSFSAMLEVFSGVKSSVWLNFGPLNLVENQSALRFMRESPVSLFIVVEEVISNA